MMNKPKAKILSIDYGHRTTGKVYDAEQMDAFLRAIAEMINPYAHGEKGTGDFINGNIKPAYRELLSVAGETEAKEASGK